MKNKKLYLMKITFEEFPFRSKTCTASQAPAGGQRVVWGRCWPPQMVLRAVFPSGTICLVHREAEGARLARRCAWTDSRMHPPQLVLFEKIGL